jgi:tRNA threonylcarbamoyl adenosine modification protein (Sua5/YciO/YrdC/YwlC family)
MPPTVIDLRRTEDPRDVVHRAVQALAEGQIVAFPTETDYVITASARHAAATSRLRHVALSRVDEPDLSLVLKSADEVLDWAPALTPIGRRIARRCWPGPVAMIAADDHPESLLHRLPAESRAGIVTAGRLRLRIPGHPLLADCLRMLAGPVALAEPCSPDDEPPVTVEEVMARVHEGVALAIDDGRARYAQRVSTIALEGNGFRVVRPGVVAEDTLRRLASLMVLFVCTGNTCRSPMAEALFRTLAAERLGCRPDELEQHGVIIASAGLAAWGGGPASEHAVEVVAASGGDLSAHESQPVTEALVRQADVILTMTAAHRNALLAQFPEAGGRVTMLAPDRRDVIDPIGGTVETYRKCARQIEAHLAARMDTLSREFPPALGHTKE